MPARALTLAQGTDTCALQAHALPVVLEAALVLAGLPVLARHGLPRPTAGDVLAATGASRARAYELRQALYEALPGLLRPVGRPRRVPAAPPPSRLSALMGEVCDHLLAHPGAAQGGGARGRYTDGFRRFVLELRARYPDLDDESFAHAVRVPLRTLSDWRQPGAGSAAPQAAPATQEPPGEPEAGAASPAGPAGDPRIQAILRAWEGWSGSFTAFCAHVHEHLRLPFRRTFLARILEVHGLRKPKRRPGRSPDERALQGQFQTFFPGAQWSADGATISVDVAGERHGVNLELVVDPASGALLGLSVRAQEDARALTEAFANAVEAAEGPPVALVVDNRPSNHAPEVDAALGETLRQRATPYRPQNKAHSEGAFGLLAQTAPPLVVPSLDPEVVARTLVLLVVTTWARATNHRPRVDRGGRSRAQLYADADPTPEELQEARRALEEQARKRDKARETREAREDPTKRALLDEAFARLELDDPERHQRAAISRYPLDHVVAGIAVYEGKRMAGTLPPGVDARYLLGIVRNLTERDEGLRVAEALWRARLDARDRLVVALEGRRDHLVARAIDERALVERLADEAVEARRSLDRAFWTRALADSITAAPAPERQAHYAAAARRVHAAHSIPRREREDVVRRLAAMLVPLD